MASLFKEIFLSKKDKQIIGIYNTINDYWKNTNDFTAAHIRYLQDLNHKHNLGFTEELINDLPIIILTPLINNRFSQSNAMYIFSQFVGLYIFRMGDPAIYRYSNDNLLNIAEKVTGLLIPFRSRLYPHLKYQLNKGIDVIEKFGNIDEVNAKKAKCIQNENNRILSRGILASKIGCSPGNLKQKLFEQFDSTNPSMDELLQVMMKHSSTMNEQAITYKMNPNETPAAIMIELINEYYVTYKTRIDSKNQIFRGMATEHPDVMSQILAALASGDTKRYSDLISQNPEFLDSFIDKMAENELKKEFKAKLETTLRDLIIENLNESNEIPEMFKGLMVKKVAGTFCKNTKDDYAKFKSNFTKIWNKAGLSQNEYYSIVDEVTIKVLDEFIEPPKRSEY